MIMLYVVLSGWINVMYGWWMGDGIVWLNKIIEVGLYW